MTDIYTPISLQAIGTSPYDENTTPFPEYEEPIIPDDQIYSFESFFQNPSPTLSATTAVTGGLDDDDCAPLLPHERIFPPIASRGVAVNETRRRRPSPTSPEGLEAALLLLHEAICTQRIVDPPPTPVLSALEGVELLIPSESDVGDLRPAAADLLESNEVAASPLLQASLSIPEPVAIPLPEPVHPTVLSTREHVDVLSQASPSVPKPPIPPVPSPMDPDSLASPSVPKPPIPPVPSPFDSALRKAHEIYGTPLQPTSSSETETPRDKEWETLNIMQSIAHHGYPLPPPFLLEALAYRPCDTYDAVHFARDVVLVRAKAVVAIAPSPEAVEWATVIERVYANDAVWWRLVWDVRDEAARERFVECLAEVRESWRWAEQVVSVVRERVLLGEI